MTLINTPCVGICSTVYGDDVCRGCKRFYQEIIDWNGYNDNIKSHIYQRLNTNMIGAMSQFIEIIDLPLLLKQLQLHQIRYEDNQHPFYLVHHLFRVKAHKITDVQLYGIVIKPPFSTLSLSALFTLMDKKLYEMSVTALCQEGGRVRKL